MSEGYTETRSMLLENGYTPTPCAGKAAIGDKWQTKTETNNDEIALWEKLFPHAKNTGLLTQRCPALDVDITLLPAAEAIEQLAREEFEEHGDMPVRIGRPPKRAFLFRTDEPFKKLSRSFTAPDGSMHKIEVLGDGQQIIVDGIHPDTGRMYAWHGGSPLTTKRQDLPYIRRENADAFLDKAEALLTREFGFTLVGAKANGHADDDGGTRDPIDRGVLIANILNGIDMHESTASLASSYIVSGIDQKGARRELEAIYNASSMPRDKRWKERFNEIDRAVVSAWEKYVKPGLGSETPAVGADAPMPLFPTPCPAQPFPINSLGPLLATAALAISSKIQVPGAMAAQSVLAVAALAAQAHADVLLPYGQRRPLSLYFFTVAWSGERKSSADEEALRAVRTRELALKEEYEDEMVEYRHTLAAYNAEKRKIEGNKGIDYNTRKHELRLLGDPPSPPLSAFLVAEDPTVEGLIKNWKDAHGALGIFSAEGGQFVGGYGMSPENLLKSASAFSGLWDGNPIKRVRAIDGVSILHGRRLSLHLMIQPSAATKFLSSPVLRDQGLLSRMLLAAPESLTGGRIYQDPNPEDEAAIQRLARQISTILKTKPALADGRNELMPRALTMTSGAKTEWIEFFNHIEVQLGKGGKYRDVRDIGAKIAEHAARIAGVMAIVDSVAAEEIEAETMKNAITVAQWYIDEAARLQESGQLTPELVTADKVLEFIKERGGSVGFRELVQLGPSEVRSKHAADAAVAVLAEHGLIKDSGRPRVLQAVGNEA